MCRSHKGQPKHGNFYEKDVEVELKKWFGTARVRGSEGRKHVKAKRPTIENQPVEQNVQGPVQKNVREPAQEKVLASVPVINEDTNGSTFRRAHLKLTDVQLNVQLTDVQICS